MTAVMARLAGAPISWGVCEVPGWGWQMPAETVLAQMHEVGLTGAELGPPGFLPEDAHQLAKLLAAHDLSPVGQFLPLVLHHPNRDPLPVAMEAIRFLASIGARVLVVAASAGAAGYERAPDLDRDGWEIVLANLDRIASAAQERGIAATVHPHVGTMIETADAAEHVMAGSTIDLTLDTGHLAVAGSDPVALALTHPHRVAHVHLKDVRQGVARQVRTGALSYGDGVRTGLYAPLGEGDVDIAALVRGLEQSGYAGQYVLEQDVSLTGDPLTGGSDPRADVRTSIAHLSTIHRELESRSATRESQT